MHRFMTLGHIVATTKLREQADDLENVANIIFDVQQQLEDDGSDKTLAEVFLQLKLKYDMIFYAENN